MDNNEIIEIALENITETLKLIDSRIDTHRMVISIRKDRNEEVKELEEVLYKLLEEFSDFCDLRDIFLKAQTILNKYNHE